MSRYYISAIDHGPGHPAAWAVFEDRESGWPFHIRLPAKVVSPEYPQTAEGIAYAEETLRVLVAVETREQDDFPWLWVAAILGGLIATLILVSIFAVR